MEEQHYEKSIHQGFPTFLAYQCERLVPVAKLLLLLSVAYLLSFVVLDYFNFPEHIKQITLFRVLAAAPLLLLVILLHRSANPAHVPMYFLSLGLLSFTFFLALNLVVPEKQNVLLLVPMFYILAVMAMAPLFKTSQLLLTFFIGFLVYYFAGVFFIRDQVFVSSVFPHMTAITLFTLISVIKIKQSAEENYALAKKLHWRSHHDELTFVYNRRGVFAWLDQEPAYLSQLDTEVALVMLDLDHFKHINDAYGHAVGDMVIKDSAQLILDELGVKSRVARFGGEEFLVVLNEGSAAANLDCAKTIWQRFHNHRFSTDDGQLFQVTASMGYVNHNPANEFEDSLKEADKCMYQAKNQGRDQLIASAA